MVADPLGQQIICLWRKSPAAEAVCWRKSVLLA
jgi:hypothetical protein